MFGSKRRKAVALKSLEQLDELVGSGKPVLLDFWQVGCSPCRVMNGIVDELADEFHDSAHVVKVDARRVPDATMQFRIRSTPTFVLLAVSERSKRKGGGPGKVTQRWRATGLVKKDALRKVLVSNGAAPAEPGG